MGLILTIILLLVTVLAVIADEIAMAVLSSLLCIMCLILSLDEYNKKQNLPVYIDLPEEHKAITWKSNKPDTLYAFHRNDSLIIQFKP